jgi:hypothetical protein
MHNTEQHTLPTQVRLGDYYKAKHLYSLEVAVDGTGTTILVDACNRTQAASIAKRAGYEVFSVNMIG